MTEHKTRNYILTILLTVALIVSSFAVVTPVFAETDGVNQETEQPEETATGQEEAQETTGDAAEATDSKSSKKGDSPSDVTGDSGEQGDSEDPGTTDPDPEPTPTPAEVVKVVPKAPSKVSVSYNYVKNTAKISWTKVANATGYKIYYKKTNKLIKTINSNTTSYTYKKQLKYGSHVFYVQAIAVQKDTEGNEVLKEDGTKKIESSSKTKGTFKQKYLTEKVRTYRWMVKTKGNITLYRFRTGSSKKGTLKKGISVRVTKHAPNIIPLNTNPKRLYAIQYKNGKVVRTGWVKYSSVTKPKAELAPKAASDKRQQWSPQAAENYVNKKGYTSKTKYMVWANLYTQRVYIFKGKKGHWKLTKTKQPAHSTGNYRTYRFESGMYGYGTKRGVYSITKHQKRKISRKSKSGNPYYYINLSYFYKGNSFHTVCWSLKTNRLVKGMSGSCRPSTHGCVRMDTSSATWIYKHIPTNSRVVVD